MPRKAQPSIRKQKHEICERLRRIAVGRGFDCAMLAHEADMRTSTVYAILWGNTICPKFSNVEKLVTALDAAWMTIIEQRDRSAEVTNLSIRRRKRAT